MNIQELTPSVLALLIGLIIGMNELVTRLRAKDKWAALTIALAAVIGGAVAAYYKLDVLVGVAAGFTAVGTLKIVGNFGNGSKPVERNITGETK